MEKELIDAISKLTSAVNELNKKLEKPLDVHQEVYSMATDLKYELQELKSSINNLNETMSD